MRELGFDGMSEDQRFLIVRDPSTDEQFRVRLDDEAAALVSASGSPDSAVNPARTDVPSSATGSEPAMDTPTTTLSPRDIQARIRRGESAQQVAESSGMPIERIEPFAVPVVAEREYMAEQARKTSLRRKHVTGAGQLLGTLVDTFIVDRGGSPEAAAWDSWRREDGRWTVLVTPAGSDHTATFLFDARGRYVVPADDAAHDLVGDVALPDTPDMAIADVVRESAPQAEVASAPDTEPTVEIELEALSIHEDESGQVEIQYTDLIDVLEDMPADVAAAQAMLAAADQAHSGVSSLKAARDRRAQEALARQESEAEVDAEVQAEVDHLEDSIETDVAVPDTAGPRGKKRQERRRVPSWDEIMFGGKDD